MSIAMSCNVYQDATALRGLLESASGFFDELFVVHAGPNGAYSTDGTIEVCEQFGVKLVFDDIGKGFGIIRTRLVHDCGCDWAMILDADERFHQCVQQLECHGTERWDWQHPEIAPRLDVAKTGVTVNQGQRLRELTADPATLAVRTVRRHWLDFTNQHPTQNWHLWPDWQLRIVRNQPEVVYKSEVKMHEQLIDTRTGTTPQFVATDLHHDHYHPFFRRCLPGSKQWNEVNYRRLEQGERMEQHG